MIVVARCSAVLRPELISDVALTLESGVPVVMVYAHLVSNCAHWHTQSSKHLPAAFWTGKVMVVVAMFCAQL